MQHDTQGSLERCFSNKNGNIYWVSKEERKTLGINQQEERRPPPPWGWSVPSKKECPRCSKIVYYGSSYTTHNTKGGHHEQKELYHKKDRRRSPNFRNAKDSWPSMEQLSQSLHANFATKVCRNPQHFSRNLETRICTRCRAQAHS